MLYHVISSGKRFRKATFLLAMLTLFFPCLTRGEQLIVLEGKWEIVEFDYRGVSRPLAIGWSVEFKDGKMTLTQKDERKSVTEYQLDMDRRPAWLDWVDIAADRPRRTYKGICVITTDTLRWKYGKSRPTELDSDLAHEYTMLLLKRVGNAR